MALNKPRTFYGLHSATMVNRTTGMPYGILKVLKSASTSANRDAVELFGGSNPNAFESEYGNISSEVSLTFSEFKPFLFTLAGYDVTTNAAESSGSVSTTPTNANGTTVVSAAGITALSLSTGLSADLKDGEYVIIATSTAAIDVYAVTDINYQNGTDITLNDALDGTGVLKITTAAITLTASAVTVPGMGIKVTGVASPALTVGDTATFTVRGVNVGSYEYSFGENPQPLEFGMYLYSQKKSNGEYSVDYYPRVKFGNIPLARNEKAFTEASVPVKVLFDSAKGFAMKHKDLVKTLN